MPERQGQSCVALVYQLSPSMGYFPCAERPTGTREGHRLCRHHLWCYDNGRPVTLSIGWQNERSLHRPELASALPPTCPNCGEEITLELAAHPNLMCFFGQHVAEAYPCVN